MQSLKLQSASYIVGTFIRSQFPCGIPSLGWWWFGWTLAIWWWHWSNKCLPVGVAWVSLLAKNHHLWPEKVTLKFTKLISTCHILKNLSSCISCTALLAFSLPCWCRLPVQALLRKHLAHQGLRLLLALLPETSRRDACCPRIRLCKHGHNYNRYVLWDCSFFTATVEP